MKIHKYLLLFLISGSLMVSCSQEDLDDNVRQGTELPGEEPTNNLELEIKDFEYKAMDIWYLYNDEMAIYNDDYFSTQSELNDWLTTWETPEKLFYEGLLYNYPNTDRFSWIVDDYTELENFLSGNIKTSGMEYGLSRYCGGCSEVLLYAKYVLPGSPADQKGITRGMIFTEINGTPININNYRELIAIQDPTYTVGKFENDNIITTDETISVVEVEFQEDPVHVAKTIDLNGVKVGYLMYNAFYFEYDDRLNEVFAQFKADGISELVLDLRYNGGGRISSALDLSSMIAGQLIGKPFIRVQYNNFIQSVYESQNPSALNIKLDGTIYEGTQNSAPINSLNLEKIYVIATGSSASASELVMNGLEAYIDVVHIGTKTVGKVQGSDTYYDSDAPNFNKDESLNPDHKYALQPLILTLVNANNEAYPQGMIPDIEQQEFVNTLGVLGDPNEPLLSVALNQISQNRFPKFEISKESGIPVDLISESRVNAPTYQRMYMDVELPSNVKAGVEFKKD